MITQKLRNYLYDDDFKIIIINKKINISNYERIEYLDTDKIILKHKEGNINIKGENMTVSKLLNQEILISGNIKEIEMR